MSDLTKLTVSLIPKAAAALNETAERTGHSRTDVVNRALQVYAALTAAIRAGGAEVTIENEAMLWVVPPPPERQPGRWRRLALWLRVGG